MTGATVAEAPAAAAPMRLILSDEQRSRRAEFRRFAEEHVVPFADDWDRAAEMPRSAIEALIDAGYLGTLLPAEMGGAGFDALLYGLLTEELGRGCSSLRSLLTVHDMVAVAVKRWGSAEMKQHYLPLLAQAEKLGAVAITEPEVGSDAARVAMRARRDGDDYVLDGTKRWITYGAVADVFLLLARDDDDKLTTFLLEADSPGFERRPMRVTGTRAAMLAELSFDGCRVPAARVVGRPGFGFSHVMATALDQGRYSVAWGSVGIAQACLEATSGYATERQQFGGPIFDHQLVRRKLTEMIAGTQAARLMCCRAGSLRDEGDPNAVAETLLAKYFASRAAVDAASSAVQLHGAHGVSEDFPLMRYLRDAKVTEIIEGSSQILQFLLPRYPLPEL